MCRNLSALKCCEKVYYVQIITVIMFINLYQVMAQIFKALIFLKKKLVYEAQPKKKDYLEL